MAGTKKLWLALCPLTLTLAVSAFAEGKALDVSRPPHSLEAEVDIMTKSMAPMVSGHWVIFAYRPTSSARYVALRFEHEGYAVLHPFRLNQKKIFVLIYRPPERLSELTYRISVDGMWMSDPANPNVTTDAFGAEYSRVDLTDLLPEEEVDPSIAADGSVTFTYRGTPERLVSIAGTFNLWDPYVYAMEETALGVYSITLRLPPGPYYYYFLENGKKRLDPSNGEIRHSSEGEVVCYFEVP